VNDKDHTTDCACDRPATGVLLLPGRYQVKSYSDAAENMKGRSVPT
jgi:hypothetical protein